MSGLKRSCRRYALLAAALAGFTGLMAQPGWAGTSSFVDGPAAQRSALGRQVRCMALVAYAEAAVDGAKGMDGVIRVIRNRMRSGTFPDDACKVVLQQNQFQPVSENANLRKVLEDPEAYSFSSAFGSIDEGRMTAALKVAAASFDGIKVRDPTVGALFFVNPLFMDADKCPWFAALKKTAQIGGHVFMTHYGSGEKSTGPAIDCSVAGTGKSSTGTVARASFGDPLPRSVGIVLRDGRAVAGQRGARRDSEFGNGPEHRRVTVVLGGRIDSRINSVIAEQ